MDVPPSHSDDDDVEVHKTITVARRALLLHVSNNKLYNWHNLFSDGAGMNLCSRQPEDDTLMLPSGTEIEVKPPESCLWPNAMQVKLTPPNLLTHRPIHPPLEPVPLSQMG